MTKQFGEGVAVSLERNAFQQLAAFLLGGNAIVPLRWSQRDVPHRARGSFRKLLPG
jgi:hypothetical protein